MRVCADPCTRQADRKSSGMSKRQQKILFVAVRKLMRPLVRILLRNGVAYGALADAIRKCYVDVAFEDFSPEGKKQTVSRVSALTGLTRKEVKRLHELDGADHEASQERYNRAVRVISGWMNDRRFLDAKGKPAVLPLQNSKKSFEALVRGYSGDIPVRAMLAMLEEAGSVSTRQGKVRLIKHAYVPAGDDEARIRILGTDVSELISTIDHNLTAAPDELLFQRKVAYEDINPESLDKLKKLSFSRAQSLLERLDREYAKHEQTEDAGEGVSISLGIYYHEQKSPEE
jgi:hypothetical protein